ncbi:MAG: glyoxalase/bleomycin resistance/extradiol dioxygenase family protein [Pseudomonadota bacterium]|nr:glyoxalase/bleomycin resistance/extradiol dioxygenase family protein [Pseudomonadota bacterium]
MTNTNTTSHERSASTDAKPDQGPTNGVTPHLTIAGKRATEAIEFYKKAFGAEEAMPPYLADDGERIMHAHIRVNGGSVMLNDEFPEYGECGAGGKPGAVTLHLQVDDADRWFDRATKAGADVTMPLDDQFWGDRYGQVKDPFGHSWSIGAPAKK